MSSHNIDKDIKFLRLTWYSPKMSTIISKAVFLNPNCPHDLDEVTECGLHHTLCDWTPPDEIETSTSRKFLHEVQLKPDWSTLTNVPYSKGHARVMINMYEDNGDPSPLCPRLFLQKMMAEAAKEGIYVKAGYESQFILLQPIKEDGVIKPIDDTPYCSTLSMDMNCDIITDIIDALVQQGIQIELYHPEAAHGQQELSIRYTDVLIAADQQIIVRETVKAIALKHNRLATFIPTLFSNQTGNTAHTHLSLHTKDGKNIVPSDTKPNEISDITGHFIAGMLEHMEGLMLLSRPTTNSMRSINPSTRHGAFKIWGYDNREAAIRVPFNGTKKPNPTHFEFKISDASGNPYLVLGAIIAAGMDGIKRKLPLPAPYHDDPGLLSLEELQALNITRLPNDLQYTIDAFSKDKVLLEAFGPQLSQCIIACRRKEYKTMKDMSLEEERKLLLQKY